MANFCQRFQPTYTQSNTHTYRQEHGVLFEFSLLKLSVAVVLNILLTLLNNTTYYCTFEYTRFSVIIHKVSSYTRIHTLLKLQMYIYKALYRISTAALTHTKALRQLGLVFQISWLPFFFYAFFELILNERNIVSCIYLARYLYYAHALYSYILIFQI